MNALLLPIKKGILDRFVSKELQLRYSYRCQKDLHMVMDKRPFWSLIKRWVLYSWALFHNPGIDTKELSQQGISMEISSSKFLTLSFLTVAREDQDRPMSSQLINLTAQLEHSFGLYKLFVHEWILQH